MSKGIRLVTIVVLLLLGIGSASLAVTFPTVQYIGFDPLTYTYTYKVIQPAVEDCIYAFDSFEIDGMMPLRSAYDMEGPFVGSPKGENLNWATRVSTYPPNFNKMGYEWYADDSEKQIPPGFCLEDDWVGYFKLIVPDSMPMANGDAVTRELGTPEAEHSNLGIMAPNPVPEPAGLAVLTTMSIFAVPALLRRRRS